MRTFFEMMSGGWFGKGKEEEDNSDKNSGLHTTVEIDQDSYFVAHENLQLVRQTSF